MDADFEGRVAIITGAGGGLGRAYAEDLAATMLGTILGVEVDVDASWDQKKEIYRISDKIVKSTNITQSAVGKKGLWTTTVAAAVGTARAALTNRYA